MASHGTWQVMKTACDKFLPGMVLIDADVAVFNDNVSSLGNAPEDYAKHIELGKQLIELMPQVIPHYLWPAHVTLQSKMDEVLGTFLP